MSWLTQRSKPFHAVKGHLYLWDVAYFEHLIAEINALLPDPASRAFARSQELIKKFNERESDLTRSDLLELEQLLLEMQSTQTLIQRAPILRLRYSEIVGANQYAVYKPVDISQCKPGDESVRASLLSDLKNLVSGVHWRYILLPMVDKLQRNLTESIIVWVVGYTLCWALSIYLTGEILELPFLSMIATVVYAGVVGGYVSALRRVQSVRPENDSLLTIQGLQSSRYFLWLSPMLGAIFAVVLLLIFLGGIVSGTVFPKILSLDCPENCTFPSQLSHWPFWLKLRPESSVDYAKLFLWSFIAGFAERFVPDILDRVVQRSQSQETAPPPLGGETKPGGTSQTKPGGGGAGPEGEPEGKPEGEPKGEPQGKSKPEPEGEPKKGPDGAPKEEPHDEPKKQPEGKPKQEPQSDPQGEPKGGPEGKPEGDPQGPAHVSRTVAAAPGNNNPKVE